jgi:hypothetical protein
VTISAHPLQWPAGWKRIDAHYRRAARFIRGRRQTGLGWESSRPVTLTEAVDRVLAAGLLGCGSASDDPAQIVEKPAPVETQR